MSERLAIEAKIARQMLKRGWTRRDIEQTLAHPYRIVETTDMRWRADGSRRHDPAKAYIREDGHYVVRNEVDGTIVQISNRHRLNWRSPFGPGE
jgi:colicin-like ribonuclease protein